MIFSRKTPRKMPPKLVIEGGEVEYATHVKYLGVILDQKLNYEKHISDKIDKARRAIHAARNKIKGTIGPHPKSIK